MRKLTTSELVSGVIIILGILAAFVICLMIITGCSGVTEPDPGPYQPKVGPLKGDGPWGYCIRSYSSKSCGNCHIIY